MISLQEFIESDFETIVVSKYQHENVNLDPSFITLAQNEPRKKKKLDKL